MMKRTITINVNLGVRTDNRKQLNGSDVELVERADKKTLTCEQPVSINKMFDNLKIKSVRKEILEGESYVNIEGTEGHLLNNLEHAKQNDRD